MMTVEQLYEKFIEYGKELGCKPKENEENNGNTIVRKNIDTSNPSEYKKGAYFGFISPKEEKSGPYSDFSLVLFPQIDCQYCVLSLGIGSNGFKNDYEFATMPWLKRLFSKLRNKDYKTFFKSDFSDLESSSNDLYEEIRDEYPDLKETIYRYKKVLPASVIIDLKEEEELPEIIKAWIATYAKFRGWGKVEQKKKIEKVLHNYQLQEAVYTPDDLYRILLKNRFVVLQGAPGTGKTFTALKIAENKFDVDNIFFNQFHAETTYSDFIYGIRPHLDAQTLTYEANEGVLYKAIKKAKETSDNVLLIIDEINRANLSNVLGPVFYLFEKHTTKRECKFKIGDETIQELPKNLFVIATMNTADRSLAVVDFALRRRFTWITLKPHKLLAKEIDDNEIFEEDAFLKFDELFQKYASDDELNLQPGQSYFIVSKNEEKKEMGERIKFELMPLIKEYFNEGFMLKAKDEFSNYFYDSYGLFLYE